MFSNMTFQAVAEIGHLEWRGKHGDFSESFFHFKTPSRSRAEVEGAEPPEALEIVAFLRAQTHLESSIC